MKSWRILEGMEQITLVPGQTYRVRLTNGAWHNARFIREEKSNGFRRAVTHYTFCNLDSEREVTIKSKVRIKEAKA